MSSNLFVDVDDTLILYDQNGPNPYGIYYGVPYTINQRLLEGIRSFHNQNPQSMIVVWSGGGKDYAEMWIRNLGLENIALGLCKDRDTYILVHKGDIVIDDMSIEVRTHNPFEWPES